MSIFNHLVNSIAYKDFTITLTYKDGTIIDITYNVSKYAGWRSVFSDKDYFQSGILTDSYYIIWPNGYQEWVSDIYEEAINQQTKHLVVNWDVEPNNINVNDYLNKPFVDDYIAAINIKKD